MKFRHTLLVLAVAGFVPGFGCSSSDSNGNAVTGPVGGAVVGATDDRCAAQPIGVSDPAVCTSAPSPEGDAGASGNGPSSAADSSSAAGTAGAADCNLTHDADFGDTQYASSGKDDDCKYNVSWTSTPIRKGANVTFTVTLSEVATGAPLERIAAQKPGATALSRVEPYIPCEPKHFAPPGDLSAPIKETLPGVYEAGPIVFDESGRWAVRFHFYEECVDSETSPHGHAAFFVDVP